MDSVSVVLDFKEIVPILDKYKSKRGSLITVLQEAQNVYGYLSIELLEFISTQINVKPAKVFGVATFYTQFRLNPVGKYIIMLCQGTACHVNSSMAIYDALCDELSIVEGQTTDDGLFTLENVACLGCCSLSPAMMINGEVYGSLTPDNVRLIIRNIREEGIK